MDNRTKRVLFVCTGNTCRSPMAEGLARLWGRDRSGDGRLVEVASAGIAAGDGQPASEQTLDVLRERGIDLSDHRSRQLTQDLIDWADVIFVMTPAHAQAIAHMAPGASGKVFPIDPLGGVDDPIGHPIGVYRDVADQLEKLIEARFKEIINE